MAQIDIMRLREALPAAVIQMHDGTRFGGPFVVLEFRTEADVVRFFLPHQHAAWAQAVAAAVNTPVAAEVAA